MLYGFCSVTDLGAWPGADEEEILVNGLFQWSSFVSAVSLLADHRPLSLDHWYQVNGTQEGDAWVKVGDFVVSVLFFLNRTLADNY